MTTLAPALAPDTQLLDSLNARFEGRPPQELIEWATEAYRGRLGLSCSFGGTTGMVLVDLVLKVDPTVTVFYIDTGFLFPETHATIAAVRERYGIEPAGFAPTLSIDDQARLHGPALWDRDADACCELRKVQPMHVAMSHFNAYFTGLRRDQASTRTATPMVQWDAKFNLLKLSPLVTWTEKDVWSYIMANNLPYNALHDRGYPSIGCTNCTKAVNPGDDPRSGRWSGSDKVECGLHTSP